MYYVICIMYYSRWICEGKGAKSRGQIPLAPLPGGAGGGFLKDLHDRKIAGPKDN